MHPLIRIVELYKAKIHLWCKHLTSAASATLSHLNQSHLGEALGWLIFISAASDLPLASTETWGNGRGFANQLSSPWAFQMRPNFYQSALDRVYESISPFGLHWTCKGDEDIWDKAQFSRKGWLLLIHYRMGLSAAGKMSWLSAGKWCPSLKI